MHNLDDLLQHLKSLQDPIVVGHENADPDAVASAYGISRLLGCDFGFPTEVSRDGREVLRYLGVSYHINPDVRGMDLVIVDTSTREMLGDLDIEGARSVTVIDHHSSKPTIEGRHFIFEDYTSTSEIVLDLFTLSGMKLDEKTRKALLIGIITDSRYLTLARGTSLIKVGKILGEDTPQNIIEMFKVETDVSERIARLKALRKGEIFRIGDFLIVIAESGSFEASVANILIQAGADVAIVFSERSTEGRIIFRISKRASENINTNYLFKVAEKLGASCGGHPAAGGCHTGPHSTSSIARAVVDAVIEHLNKDRGFVVQRY